MGAGCLTISQDKAANGSRCTSLLYTKRKCGCVNENTDDNSFKLNTNEMTGDIIIMMVIIVSSSCFFPRGEHSVLKQPRGSAADEAPAH